MGSVGNPSEIICDGIGSKQVLYLHYMRPLSLIWLCLFKDTNLCTIQTKQIMIMPKDMKLVRWIQGKSR